MILFSIGRCDVLGIDVHVAFRRTERRGGGGAGTGDGAQAQVSTSKKYCVCR